MPPRPWWRCGGGRACGPARQVSAGFGPITVDNRRVIVQEWLAEAFPMWGIARARVYRAAAGLLATLGTLTGARTRWCGSRSPGAARRRAGLLLAASWL